MPTNVPMSATSNGWWPKGHFDTFSCSPSRSLPYFVITSLLINNAISLSIAILLRYIYSAWLYSYLSGELINGYDKLLLQAADNRDTPRITQIVDHSHRRLIVARGKIEFHDVSYAYPMLAHDVSLRFATFNNPCRTKKLD